MLRGPKRVLIFCCMITVLPTILVILPLYLRHVVYADVIHTVTESDILEISKGISSIFCSEQSLQMNSSFNAFQLKQVTMLNTKRKHIRLRKSMSLPDDTLEYWGFYLLNGATVILKVCSRYEGSRILVVRGERNLRTCGLMEHNINKFGAAMDEDYKQVKVSYESAQEIEEINTTHVMDSINVNNIAGNQEKHNIRHKNFLEKIQSNKLPLEVQNYINEKQEKNLIKRDAGHLFDTRIGHGGNAINHTNTESNENSNSVSSFENNLLNCYNGQILLTKGFSPSHLCTDVNYLEKSDSIQIEYNVVSEGYYYYIFYSDNDFIKNDIHAIFDIYKPTLKFAGLPKDKSCLNKTSCTFPISFMSDESIIVEVPLRDGIEYGTEDDDIGYLISTCHPRMGIYIIFPIAILLIILCFAFI